MQWRIGDTSMGVNREDDDGSGDSWNRDARPETEGDFHGPNILGIALAILFIVVLGVAISRP